MEAALVLGGALPLQFPGWFRRQEGANTEPKRALGVPEVSAEAARDAALARAALLGDHAAFAKIVERHKHAVYAVAMRLLGPTEAQDVAQEAFLRAYERLGSYDSAQPLRPWLLGIARNHCLDQLRRRGRQPLAAALAAEQQNAAPTESPDDALDARATGARLAVALESLPERHREALLLFHQEELSYRDIAGVLGVPLGTVMTWIHRARRELRQKLTEAA